MAPGPSDLEQRARGGDLQALADLLLSQTATFRAAIGVTRQGTTLVVSLFDLDPALQESCGLTVYAVVNALALADLHHLLVLEGVPPLHRPPWRRQFSLGAKGPAPELGENRCPYFFEPLLPSAHWDGAAPVAAVGAGGPILRSPHPRLPQPGRYWWSAATASFLLGAGLSQWRSAQEQMPVGRPNQPSAVADRSSSLPSAPVGPGENPVTPAPLMARSAEQGSPPLESSDRSALTIKAVGDIILGTDYQPYRMPDDWRYFFDGIKPQLEDADLVFGNFESTLTTVPHSAKNTSRPMTFAFRSPPWYASVLRAAGFDVLSVANNHSMDFFEQGFNDTIHHIQSEGMVAVGRKGEIQYTQVNGLTVGFIGFSYLNAHNSLHDLDTAAAMVRQADQTADVVVVSVHGGREGSDATSSPNQDEYFYSENRGNLVRFARAVVDSGADLVLGHGPHVPRALELYHNRLIAYSLGNFLGYRTLSTQGALGISMILQVGLDGQGNFVNGRIIPAALDPNGVPYVDNFFGSVVLVRHLTRQDFPETPLMIDDLGHIWRRD